MSDYSQTNDFSAKDALSSGDPNKIIYGSDVDTELSAISTAISSKANKVSSATNNNVAKLDTNGDLVDSGYRFSGTSGDVTYDLTSLNGVTLALSGKSLASSDDVIDNFPSGTKMLFQQSAAPTGWTKETTHDNKALRVVTGTASSGGSVAFTTLFTSYNTDAHSLTVAELPAHTHGLSNASGTNANISTSGASVSNGNDSDTQAGNTNSAGSGSGHSHGIDLSVEYVDIIIASKD